MNHEILLGAVCYQEYSGDYLDFLELAPELNLSWVEFKYEPPLCYRDGSRRYVDIRKQADDFGIRMSMHTAFDGLNITSLDDEKRARFLDTVQESIEAAAQMDISLATLHAGHLPSVDYSLLSTGILKLDRLMETSADEKWDFPLFIETTTAEQALESKKYLERIIMKTLFLTARRMHQMRSWR